MSDIFNSTHNFNQLKQILEDKSIHNRSIRASEVSQALLHQSPLVDKKKAETVNSKKGKDFIINSPAVKQKDPDAMPMLTFKKQSIEKKKQDFDYHFAELAQLKTPQLNKKAGN